MTEMKFLLLAVLAVFTAGCLTGSPSHNQTMTPPDSAPPVDQHTSRTSLDWAGLYEGIVTCADCVGIHTRLTLEQDGRFELVERRLVRDAVPSMERGQFDWESDGKIVVLDTEDGQQRYAISEGRLLKLDSGEMQPAWDKATNTLAQVSPDWRDGRQTLGAVLEDHRWNLVDARDQETQRIDALFPDAERSFVFAFEGSRLHARGGCNGLRGAYRISADGLLTVTGAMSTMMACAAPLMEADAALTALMARPLEMVLVRGERPTLVLLTAVGDVLVLTGDLTPEARFGAPTTIFLEVAAQTVTCEGSMRADGRCLQVRERIFDEQGLMVGTPSEWQLLNTEIEGYQHEPGIRNILRVKRFQPPVGSEVSTQPIYVLDLVVQSEVVTD